VLLVFARKSGGRTPTFKNSSDRTRFTVLIPARNESRVIEDNLRAIFSSDYPKENLKVYVIVEREDDPTVGICSRYGGVEVFYRQDLSKAMKGYALDECVKDILERGEESDAFVVLDADNVVAPEFFSRMSDAYAAGYDAGAGRRNNKDWNSSVVSSASALTFSAINTLQNKPKSDRGMSIMFSGTGFFVSYRVLSQLGGWPFASLTEDYEFSSYAVCSGLKTVYVEEAMYYDEQPTTLSQSIVQRTRWVRGFFHVRRAYGKKRRELARRRPMSRDVLVMKLGTVPLLAFAFDCLLYLFSALAFIIAGIITRSPSVGFYTNRLLFVIVLIYLAIILFTVFLFRKEGDAIDITDKNKFKTVLYHPFFLSTYVVSAVRCLFVKDRWEVIEHTSGKK
jgi:cellulose synthase/poly-beta-1,6-N-acetylglucosamine synthase-like glycosyltransferase